VRGEGAYLYTDKGEKYLDFIAGIAVTCLGHNHPDLVKAIQTQAGELLHLSNMFRVKGQFELADKYCAALPFAEKVFFTNSGAEALECAMKTARRCNPKYVKGFGPKMPGFINLPFGDHDALDAAITPQTAAILVEPVQGEGGLRPLPEACLKGLRQLCDEKGIVLIYDEVQCGAGRTGKLFAHQWADGAEPDIMAIAKGVGGGFPFGACLAREEMAQYMVPGTHGSTYGGNPLAMAAGNAVFDIISQPDFLDHVVKMSNRLKQQFEGLKDRYPDVVEEIRGKGLLIGMKLKKDVIPVRTEAREKGLLAGSAGDNVLRMAPPLIIDESHIHEAVAILEDCFKTAQNAPDL